MIQLVLILFLCFVIGLPIVLIFRWLKKKLSKTGNNSLAELDNIETNISADKPKFKFMDDYQMWLSKTEVEKEFLLKDIEVIFEESSDLIKKEMIKQSFTPGSKIIDISYFSGLSEFGSGIITFLIQHENGGEIRSLSINIDLEKMKLVATSNLFHSTGKERYYYLKKNKGLVKI